MPLYTYRCEECFTQITEEMTFAEHDEVQGFLCDCGENMRQVLSFSFHRGTPEHFNHTVNAYVSNDRQFDDELKRQSDEMSARMGFDHSFERVDPMDPGAVGVTDAGLEESARALHDSGEVTSGKKIIV